MEKSVLLAVSLLITLLFDALTGLFPIGLICLSLILSYQFCSFFLWPLLGLACLAGIIFILLIRRQSKKVDFNAQGMIHKTAVVKKTITRLHPGEVKVYGEIWTAITYDHEPITVNEQVVIHGLEGNKVIVKRLSHTKESL